MEVSKTEGITVMDEVRNGKGRRAVFPPDVVKELEKLSPEERHQRMLRYVEEHGEDVEPVDGWTSYGPRATRPPDGHNPPE
jgi:hypothetical protein